MIKATDKEMDIPADEDYKIRPLTPEEKKRKDDNEEAVPEYRLQIKFDEEQKDRLTEQAFMEFEAFKNERTELKLEGKWKALDNQYDGELRDNKLLAFNLDMKQSKIKVDAIVRAIKESIMESDPIVDVSPRPETARKDGYKVAERQAEFLDYAMDEEIRPEIAIEKIAKSAVKKFVGIGKVEWSYRREKRKREECYEGKNVPQNAGGRITVDNEGLRQFLSAYPDAMEKHRGYVKRLLQEKDVEIVVEYKDTINNNPVLKSVKVENFYVRNGCDYWEGLRTEHCVVERLNFTYWELMKKEADGEFEDVEALFGVKDKKIADGQAKDYQTADYDVLEFTIMFKLDEDDDDEIKLKAWFGEEKKAFLGAILYPYYAFDTDYIPFYVVLNEYGFYGDARSVMYDLLDTHIAEDATINLMLHGNYVRNMITPIVKEGSDLEAIFLENTFVSGKPLPVDEMTEDVNKAVGFVQWPNVDNNASFTLLEVMKRIQSDVSRVSDLTSGGESRIDPNAPAQKTRDLLNQSGKGIKDYILTFLPSFNIFCVMVLQLYYQMSQEGRKYKIRRKSQAVTGEDPFGQLNRDEMIAKTTVQARAAAFAFDKQGEKEEAMVGLQLVRSDPYAMQQPEIQYQAFTIALETLGGRWKNLTDKMVTPEQFKQQQMQLAVQAVQMLMQGAQKQQQTTGVAPNVTPEQAGAAVTQTQSEAYNPALKEARMEQEEKQAA